MKTVNVLMIGDIVGEPGLEACAHFLPDLICDEKLDFIIANGENAAKDGKGLLPATCERMFGMGVDVITTGNHVWRYDQIIPYMQTNSRVVRPVNYPATCPGSGVSLVEKNGLKFAVVNLMGRTFMKEQLACPLTAMDNILEKVRNQTKLIFVDFHAEATSEKQMLGFYLDGQVSAVVGTHTHVPTADNRVLPAGTGYHTDLGFCGPLNSCIGADKAGVTWHYKSQMPARFKVAQEKPWVICGTIFTIDVASGLSLDTRRVYKEFIE